jgi:c-di-AMP phosphodiesterase-like protein
MKLICIDDETDILNFGDGVKELTWGKEYQINSHYDSTNGKRYYSILNDKGVGNDYLSDRFVTLEKFREIQLNKIGI